MNSYILLRDNKESASLSFTDLQQMGLKSTDLIWVECQSVGWRNPHEIKELRDLVNSSNNIAITPKPVQTELSSPLFVAGEPVPVVSEGTGIDYKKKLVYVELPAKFTPVKKQIEQDFSPIKEDLPENYQYAGLADPVKTIVEVTPSEKTDPVITKYSRPLDEIKEMYVKNMEEQGKRKETVMTLPTIRLSKELKKVLFYSGLVLAGALVMLLFRTKAGKAPASITQNSTRSSSIPINKDTVTSQPPLPGKEAPVNETTIPVSVISSTQVAEKTSVTPTKKLPAEKRTIAGEQDPETGKEVAEKTKPATEESSGAKPVSTEGISSQLSLKANDFSIGSFGGIKNLEMTLQNDSKYLLDKVVVEMRYLNPEGMTIITDDIHFKSVYPGAAETVAVKKSRRGVKIAYKITRIESKEIGGSTTGL